MAIISDKLNKILSAVFGKDVRQALHDGLDAINKETESTTSRQDYLDRKYDEQIKNMTLQDPSSAEIVDMRVAANGKTFEKAGDRLNYFDEQLDKNTNRIETNISKINQLDTSKASKDDVARISSGTPLFANSISEMIDNTKNYVNLNDKYVYIYNGSSFEKTDVLYQAQGIENESVTKARLENKIQALINEKYETIEQTYEFGKYASYLDGSIIDVGGDKYGVTSFYVKSGEKLRISGNAEYGACLFVLLDKENKKISSYPTSYQDAKVQINNYELIIPNNCFKIVINTINNKTIVEKISKYNFNLKEIVTSGIKPSYKSLSLDYTEGQYYLYNTGDTLQSTESNLYQCCIEKIKVAEGDIFKGSGISRYGAYTFIVTDVDGRTVAKFPENHLSSDVKLYDNIEFTVPADGVYLLVNSSSEYETVVKRMDGYEVYNGEKDKCDGKVYVFDGDSITYGAGVSDHTNGILPNKNMGWVYGFQQKHPKAICYGYAQSGWRIARKSTDSTSLLQHITEYPSNVDYFVLSGGYNDQAQNIPLGVISDKYYNCEFDEYTFTGALESYFRQLVQKYPDAKKLYILTPKRIYSDSSSTTRFNNYWQRIREVCDKWAIEFKDLSKVGGVVGTNESEIIDGVNVDDLMFADTLGTGHGDYCHPNERFYEKHLNDKVDSAIISL